MALEALGYSIAEGTRRNADWMIRKHYLKKWPGVVVKTWLLLSKLQPVGVIVFALPPRETSVRYGGVTWELARLWVADDMPRNTETWFIAQALRLIRQQHKDVDYVVSYADPSVGHQGVIYRAGNFRIDGRTDDKRHTPRFDYQIESGDMLGPKRFSRKGHVPRGATTIKVARVSKHRYVMPMNKKARRSLEAVA